MFLLYDRLISLKSVLMKGTNKAFSVTVLMCLAWALPLEAEKVEFSLMDSYGREISSQDYKGVPIFLEFGACWWGGCQQEALRVAALAKDYRRAGLQVIRVISGDNELSALDFQKHYRMPIIHLLDSDRAFERRHNRNGWPFLMLADPNGQVVYKCNNLIDRDRELMQQLQKYENESFRAETKTADGIFYPASALQRSGEDKKPLQNDRFTSIAAAAGGQIYAVFTSLKNGNSDIILRICNDELSYKDIPIGATDADEYDGTVLADTENQVWVCWTSNAVDDKYQIHLTSLKDVQEGRESVVVSKSKDDAMHGAW
jgi:peroxiredoxin